MAYEELGELRLVQLGGVNKVTGKNNPTEVEGYYLGSEDRPNRFDPKRPQKLYKFQTQNGDVGVFGKAGLDKVMKGATIGAMTKVVSTGETLDTGKGNPMKIFKAYQDKGNTTQVTTGGLDQPGDEYEEVTDEDTSDEVQYTRPTAPSTVATTPNAATRARVEALMKNRNKAL